VDWQLERPRWRVNATIGQSYRMTANTVAFPDGTGLYDRVSDIVGRTEVRYRDLFKITHRYRLDKDTLAFRRNEIDATVGSDRDYVEIGYARVNSAIASALNDLQDSNELRAAARVSFARHWSAFGSGIFDLSNNNLLPNGTNNSFQPLRTRLGLAFNSDCFELDATWRRDYVSIGDATKGSSYLLHLAFRNIGVK
jgi:LPS-assembly protein